MSHCTVRRIIILLCLAWSMTLHGGSGYAIPPQYDRAGDFSEGLAAVCMDDQWGFIDQTGKIVVPLQFEYAAAFREGLAAVKIHGRWGFIDQAGKEIVPPQYDWVDSFSHGLAMVEYYEDDLSKYGLIDKSGKEVLPPKYSYIGVFVNGLAKVTLGEGYTQETGIDEDVHWGLIDRTGKEVVPVIYDQIGRFQEGLASVLLDGKVGFIDATGALVIPLTYGIPSTYLSWYGDVMPYFSEGMAAVWLGEETIGFYGYIDRVGKVVIPFEYGFAAPFSEGLAYVTHGGAVTCEFDVDNGVFGYIDQTGEPIIPLVYDCAYTECSRLIFEWSFADGLAQVSEGIESDVKYGFVDKAGTIIVPIQYDWVTPFSADLLFVAYGNAFTGEWDRCGLLNGAGKEVVPLGRYDDIDAFGEGYMRVLRDDLYGLIDESGEELVPCIYENVGSFREGLAAVKLHGKWGYVTIGQ